MGGVGVWCGVWCGEVYLCGGVGEADAMDSARKSKGVEQRGTVVVDVRVALVSGSMHGCGQKYLLPLVRHVLYTCMSVVHAPENTACMLSLPDLT